KKRRDQSRRENHHQDLKGENKKKRPEPPVGAALFHQIKDAEEKGDADDETHQKPLELVEEIELHGGPVKAEALFDHKSGVESCRKGQKRKSQRDTEAEENSLGPKDSREQARDVMSK